MAETKAERRASWKTRTTKTSTALKKAGATVTLGGKRSIPTSAQTPSEIRVAAFRAETPDRVVVDPVTGKHTRIDTRTGIATVVSRAPSDLGTLYMGPGTGTGAPVSPVISHAERIMKQETAERLEYLQQQIFEERLRSPIPIIETETGRALRKVTEPVVEEIEAEVKARPTKHVVTTSLPPEQYVPTPYLPGTLPEDVEYGERPKFDQPQITDIHEVIGNIVDVSRSKFETGFVIGAGEEVDADITPKEVSEGWWTRKLYETVSGKTEEYRGHIESPEVQAGIEKLIDVPFVPEFSDKFRKGVVTGLLELPADIIGMAAGIPLVAETVVRTKGKALEEAPGFIGMMLGGMVLEAKTKPGEFTGAMLGSFILPSIAPKGKVPSVFKEKLKPPAGLTAEQLLKFEAGAEIASTLKKTPPVMKEPLLFTDIKALPGETGALVETWMRAHPEQKTVIAGSTAAKAQFKGARTPGDVDIYVKDVTKAGEELYASLGKEIPPGKIKLTRQTEHGAAIVEIRDALGEWHHAVDIHKTVPAGSKLRFGMETQDPVKIAGLRYVKAGELVQRKAESILQAQEAGKIGPKSHRGKDIADFISFTEEFITQQKKQAEGAIFFKGTKTKKAEALKEKLEIYKMYSTPSYELMADTMAFYRSLGLPTRLGISAIGVGVTAAYPKEKYPKEKKVKPAPYVAPIVSDRKPYIPPYLPPRIPEKKSFVYGVADVPDEEPYPYKPPEVAEMKPYHYMPLEVPELPPPPEPPRKYRLDLDKKPKELTGIIRKETPDYAWQLANPIASLEQLLGGKRTAKRTTRKAPRTSKSRRKTIKR